MLNFLFIYAFVHDQFISNNSNTVTQLGLFF